jgi:hypothetical protein
MTFSAEVDFGLLMYAPPSFITEGKPMKRILISLCAAPLLFACGPGGESESESISTGSNAEALSSDLAPRREHAIRGEGHTSGGGGRRGGGGNGISYHGGPVMLSGAHVYFIWYGNWSGDTANTILTNEVQHIGGSPYFNINTSYTDGSGTHIANSVSYGGSTTDNYSFGTALSDANIASVVSNAITSGRLPSDASGWYGVLTSADVDATSGFCTQYCGWHRNTTVNGVAIKYAFIGNSARCPNSCAQDTTVSPNNNIGADGMASIVAHELEEAVTDPLGTAWYDSRGAENADKCAWTFGTTYNTTSNGAVANMKLGNLDYLIQQNWVNASGGYCAKSF